MHYPSPQAVAAPSLTPVIWVLGLSQIVGYGTLFYAFALLAPGTAAEFGVGLPVLFGILSASMLLAGFAGPVVGRAVDRHGGPGVMLIGTLACAASYVGLAASPNIYVFAALTLTLQILATAVLHGGASPTLSQFGGARAQQAILLLTLITGFSPSLFFPAIGWLDTTLGWRGSYVVFGISHLLVAAPCHLWLLRRLPRFRPVDLHDAAPVPQELLADGDVRPEDRRFAFWAVTMSLSLSSIIGAALTVHLVPIIAGMGLAAGAFVVSTLIGPAMIAVRIAQALFLRRVHPLAMTIAQQVLVPLSVVCLVSGLPVLPAAIIFTLMYGVGHGIMAVISSTLPLALFGRQGYGELLGRIGMYRAVVGAPAPFLVSLLWEGFGLVPTLILLTFVGSLALIPLLLLTARLASYRATA